MRWPVAGRELGQIVFDLRPDHPLIRSLGLADNAGQRFDGVLKDLTPTAFLTVGSRVAPTGRLPDMGVWNVFFDKPASRPYETFRSRVDLQRARVTSKGHRATVAFGALALGTFHGELAFTFYSGSRLIHTEAIVSTEEDRRAFLHDGGVKWVRFEVWDIASNGAFTQPVWLD